jgi:hypothetical protein
MAIEHKEKLIKQEKEEEEKRKLEAEQLAMQVELKKIEEKELQRQREGRNQNTLGARTNKADFNNRLDELRYKRYMDEIERKERQRDLEMETKKIAQKTLLIDEVERMKEIKTQKALNN